MRPAMARTRGLVVSFVIFAAALAILYRWQSKLGTPVVLALGAATGGVGLG